MPHYLFTGTNDIDFCTLFNVGLYLESSFPSEVNDEGLINCFASAGNASNIKKKASRILQDLFQSLMTSRIGAMKEPNFGTYLISGLVVTVLENVL